MAKYYVSTARGNDSTGTGSALFPWKTIGKAVGASPAITLSGTGDTLYIEPGLYREAFTFGLTPSLASPFSIVGDTDGAGFASGGYTAPVTGAVDWRAWTDELTVAGGASIAVSFNGAPYVTISKLKIIGGATTQGGCINLAGASTNFTALDCEFISYFSGVCVGVYIPFSAGAWNAVFDRCKFVFGTSTGLFLRPANNATEYNLNTLIQNCQFFGRGDGAFLAPNGGSGTALGTGVTFQNCEAYFCNNAFRVYSGNAVTMTTPIGIYNCKTMMCQTGFYANNTSMVVTDYNAHHTATPTVGVTAGSHSQPLVCPSLDFGDARLTGAAYRPFGEPSPVSIFGSIGAGGTPPSVDMTNRPRPAGLGSLAAACGALERHDTIRKETTTTVSGVGAAIDGPGDQIVYYAVDAVATTPSVQVRYDSNHGSTTKPQVIMLAAPEIGVAAQTLTMTVGPNTWETLTFAPFTPTGKGRVKIQFVPHPAAANGIMFMDSFT